MFHVNDKLKSDENYKPIQLSNSKFKAAQYNSIKVNHTVNHEKIK